MQAFRRIAPEIEHHVGRLQVALRVALLGVDEVRELDRVLDEEHRGIVADQVPVAFLGIEAQREATRVTLGVGAAFLAADGREAQEYRGGLADFREQLRLGVGTQVMGDGKAAVGAGALGMDHALGSALAVEVLQLFDQVEVLQQQRAARAGAEGILVVGDRNTGSGGETGLAHREISLLCMQ